MDRFFLEALVSFISGILVGSFLFLLYVRSMSKKRNRTLQKEVDLILNRAKSQASKVERQSKQKTKEVEEKSRKDLEEEIKKTREQLKDREYKLNQKKEQVEDEFNRKESDLKKLEKQLSEEKEILEISEKKLDTLKEDTKKYNQQLGESLEAVASMTQKEAREQLKKTFESEIKKEINDRLTQIEEDMTKKSDEKVKLMLAQAMVRYSAEVTAERTVETLPIVGSSTKGKIIGREGRNIRALEASCGVDLIIEEGQELVSISCFDPVRRAVAKKTLEKLMEDSKVHPSLIEEVVEKNRREIFSKMKEDGEKTCFDLGIHDVHPEIIRILGSLQYRFIEGQNLLKYSTEVAYIASLLASEIGLNEKVACRAGLLHAIGLGVPHRVEGNYSVIGSDFCKKHGEKEEITQAIRCHDGKVKALSLLDHVLQCAYNLSRSRSGAKRSLLESYVNRLKDLESVANSFDGVVRSFAIQAGKEIRVLVDTAKVLGDRQMTMLSRDIASKIKREMNLSGEVKVNVVREYRIIEHAR
ncbi:MAG: ribonuclease Y [Bdellovibrionales bacterium]